MPTYKDGARVTVKVEVAEVRRLFGKVQKMANPRLIQSYATFPAAKIIRDDAKRRVRRGPGVDTNGKPRKHLEEEIFATPGKRGAENGTSIAGVAYQRAPHAHLVELGTTPHIIRPEKKKRLWIKVYRVYAYFVKHPGSQARPFLKPAVRATRGAVRKKITEGLRRLLYDLARGRPDIPYDVGRVTQ